MLLRCLLLVALCLVTSHLLDALPLDQQESLLDQENDLLALESSNDAVVREKRTVGILRQAFPTVTQILDRKIQSITRLIFRIVGRLVLRGGGGGMANGGGDDGSRVQITLPTFPPPIDDDEDADDDSTTSSSDDATTTPEPSDDENAVAESNLVPVKVRKVRQAAAETAAEEEEYEDDDQAVAASDDNEVSQSADIEPDDTDSVESDSEEDPRNKRFLNLGGGAGGSGGGSGNFLFDIIRLVAGSGSSQSQDEASNGPVDENNTTDSTGKGDDGYGPGVPGPLTRLFVIANRGIANLIQDLILRLAQTSERIVNFKARLITSII